MPLGSQPCPLKFCVSQSPWTTFLLCLTTPTGKVFLLVSNQNVSCSSVCLLLMLSLCNLQEKPGCIFLTHSHQLAVECRGIPLSLLFCCVNKPSSQPLLIDHMLQPPAILVNLHSTLMYQSLSWNRRPKTGHGSPNAVSQVLNRGEGSVHLACRLQSC